MKRASRAATLNTLTETLPKKPPRVKVPITVSTPAVDPLHAAVSEWALVSPDLLLSPRGQSPEQRRTDRSTAEPDEHSNGVTFPASEHVQPPNQWWGDRRSSRCLLALEQPETHALVLSLVCNAGSAFERAHDPAWAVQCGNPAQSGLLLQLAC